MKNEVATVDSGRISVRQQIIGTTTTTTQYEVMQEDNRELDNTSTEYEQNTHNGGDVSMTLHTPQKRGNRNK